MNIDPNTGLHPDTKFLIPTESLNKACAYLSEHNFNVFKTAEEAKRCIIKECVRIASKVQRNPGITHEMISGTAGFYLWLSTEDDIFFDVTISVDMGTGSDWSNIFVDYRAYL